MVRTSTQLQEGKSRKSGSLHCCLVYQVTVPGSKSAPAVGFDYDAEAVRLNVFLNVVQRGLMWLPEAQFREILVFDPLPPWSKTADEASAAVKAFFEVFVFDVNHRDKIDVQEVIQA